MIVRSLVTIDVLRLRVDRDLIGEKHRRAVDHAFFSPGGDVGIRTFRKWQVLADVDGGCLTGAVSKADQQFGMRCAAERDSAHPDQMALHGLLLWSIAGLRSRGGAIPELRVIGLLRRRKILFRRRLGSPRAGPRAIVPLACIPVELIRRWRLFIRNRRIIPSPRAPVKLIWVIARRGGPKFVRPAAGRSAHRAYPSADSPETGRSAIPAMTVDKASAKDTSVRLTTLGSGLA